MLRPLQKKKSSRGCCLSMAARALVDKAVDIARSWGAAELQGPVSPDGSGFGLGAALPGSLAQSAPWHPQCDDKLTRALGQNGFAPETKLLELGILMNGRENPFAGAEKWAMQRRGVAVRALGHDRRACEAAFAASLDAQRQGYPAFERVFARCAQIAPQMQAVVALHGDTPAGWLLYVPEKRSVSVSREKVPSAQKIWREMGAEAGKKEIGLAMPARLLGSKTPSNGRRVRLLHMQILPQHRRTACAAALLDRAWSMAQQYGAQQILVSTIDSRNAASLRMACNVGAQTLNVYAIFLRKI